MSTIMIFPPQSTNEVSASRGQSHPLLAPLIATIFSLALLLVPIVQGAGTGPLDVPLFDPGQYTTEQLAASTLNDGIPDVWKLYYGLSIFGLMWKESTATFLEPGASIRLYPFQQNRIYANLKKWKL